MATLVQVLVDVEYRTSIAGIAGWHGRVARLYRAESTTAWFEELTNQLPESAVFILRYIDDRTIAVGYGDWRAALDEYPWTYGYILDLADLEYAQQVANIVVRRLRGDTTVNVGELTSAVIASDYLNTLRAIDTALGWSIF